jgi:hypothetical protein
MLSASSRDNVPDTMLLSSPVPHTMFSAQATWLRSTTLVPRRMRVPQMTVCAQASSVPPKSVEGGMSNVIQYWPAAFVVSVR